MILDRIEKRVLLKSLGFDEIEGNLEDVIEWMETLKNDQYLRVEIDTETYSDYDSDSVDASILLYGIRMETEEEFTKRMEDESKRLLDKHIREQKKIQDEKILYAELREKYEKELG